MVVLGLVLHLLVIKVSCLPRKLLENEDLRFEGVKKRIKDPCLPCYGKHGLCFAPFLITLKNTITKLKDKAENNNGLTDISRADFFFFCAI